MVFIDEHVKLAAGSLQNVPQFLVDHRAFMFNFLKYRVQDDNILKHVLFQHIDLVKYHICIQDEVVGVLELVAQRFGIGF